MENTHNHRPPPPPSFPVEMSVTDSRIDWEEVWVQSGSVVGRAFLDMSISHMSLTNKHGETRYYRRVRS